MLPKWLESSHVFHLNGTIEEMENNQYRSPFLLPEDNVNRRYKTLEANKAFGRMLTARIFVVVGMSFKCIIDKSFLEMLGIFGNDMHVGESRWIVVNTEVEDAKLVCEKIKKALPSVTTVMVCENFRGWTNKKFPELQLVGSIL